MDKRKVIRQSGSPQFNYSNDEVIANGDSWCVSFLDNDDEFGWLPFDHSRIINNSNFDIVFWKNFVEKHIVKSGSAYTLSEEQIEGFKITPKNVADSIPVGEVNVSMKKLPVTQNEILREKEAGKGSFLGRVFNGSF